MTDSITLLAVLVLVYIWECLVWVPRNSVVFRVHGNGRAQYFDGMKLAGVNTTGAILGSPLPHHGFVTATACCPLSLSPDGVFSYIPWAFNPGTRPEQPERFRRLDGLGALGTSDRELLVDGRRFLRVGSFALARHLADLLRRLSTAPREKREDRIEEHLGRMFDRDAIAGSLRRFRAETRLLRWLTTLLFVHLFVVVPVMVHWRGFIPTWKALLLVTVLLVLAIAWCYATAHRRLHPDQVAERLSNIVGMVLCPPMAARAIDLLGRDLFATRHPLAVASVVCDVTTYADLAARTLLDARNPILPVCPDAEQGARETEQWHRHAYLRVLEDFVARTAGPTNHLIAPLNREPGSRSYCPRCRSQYSIVRGVCRDCGGLTLVPLTGGGET